MSAPGTGLDLLVEGFYIPVAPSLNFVNAGSEISLIGTPCTGDECKDALLDYHATTYYSPMKPHFAGIGTADLFVKGLRASWHAYASGWCGAFAQAASMARALVQFEQRLAEEAQTIIGVWTKVRIPS